VTDPKKVNQYFANNNDEIALEVALTSYGAELVFYSAGLYDRTI
jgi:hypothetical protein